MANGFFTDTTICIGCKACEVACKQWNALPADGYEFTGDSYDNTGQLAGTTWRHVAFVEQPAAPDAPPTENRWLMMSDVCKHCTNAGCLEACPTGAIVRNEFGDVFIQPDVCNGCGYCVPSCPFGVVDLIAHADYAQARGFVSDGRSDDDATQRHGGVAGKCTLCYDRQKVGQIPACAKACPTESIQFGDVDELRARAKRRVETLATRGVDSYLYGVDTDTSVGDLNAFFLLTERPEAYNLPARPVLPSTHQHAGYTSGALTAAALALAGLLVFRLGGMSAGMRALRELSPDSTARGVTDGPALPAHQSPTYYDRPLLKKPHWEWEVVAYLFLGGIMGGSGILAYVASERNDAALKRNARYVAFVLASTCPLVLIKHLGRPERFLHMLRIVKFKSVMSMGVWGLIGFSIPATLSALGQAARDGLVPPRLRAYCGGVPPAVLDPLLAALGAFIAGYTGVLISATAIPFWAIGKRHIPAFSVCSGMAGACALNAALLALTGDNPRTLRKLERLERLASLAEVTLLLAFRRHAGALGDPMFAGVAGTKLRGFTLAGGILAPAVLDALPVHGRWKTLIGAALTLVGGYVLRERLIEGGKDSADDPRAASRQPE